MSTYLPVGIALYQETHSCGMLQVCSNKLLALTRFVPPQKNHRTPRMVEAQLTGAPTMLHKEPWPASIMESYYKYVFCPISVGCWCLR